MKILNYLLILFMLIVALPVNADVNKNHNVQLKVGISKGIVYRERFNKFASLGYSYDFKRISLKGEIGGWLDFQPGHKHSGFASAAFGFKAVSDIALYGETYFGPAVITHPDAQLGSYFQFHFSVGGGIQTEYVIVGFSYDHFSNASILPGPNLGRDFIILKVCWRI